MSKIETKTTINQNIEKTPWRLSLECNSEIIEPVRITKTEIKSGDRLSFWTNRLQKREERLVKLVKKYGNDQETMSENIREKFEWRSKLVESAKSRIDHWTEINKNTGEKIQKLFGGSLKGVEKVIIYQPEKSKEGELTGKNKFYTVEMKDAGGYLAPYIVEQPEMAETVGTISPTVYVDRNSGQVWILTENDGQAKVQKDANPDKCMRAVRASVDNPLFNVANLGEVSATGYINAARIKGLVAEKYSAIFDTPESDLIKGKLIDIPDGKGGKKQVFYKAMSLSEYHQTTDIPGKAAVLDALLAMQEQGSILIHFGMPQVRK